MAAKDDTSYLGGPGPSWDEVGNNADDGISDTSAGDVLPELPDWIPPIPRVPANSLPPTPPRGSIAIAGEGSLIPEAYGRVLITRPRIFTIGYKSGVYWFGALWCAGECEEIESLWAGDELWSSAASSIYHTNYTGTAGQPIDPKLAAWITGYSDAMPNLCYTALGFPYDSPVRLSSLRAILKAKKVYDPRTTLTEYTTNFPLMFRDLAVAQGLTVDETNIITAANFNDEDLDAGAGTHKRRWGGILFDKQQTVDKQLQLIAEHAGCFYVREAGIAKLIPDAPASSIATFSDAPGTANIVKGSVKLSKRSLDNLPNHSIVEYLSPAAWPWRTGYAETPLPAGEVRSTNFRMRGFQSYSVAYRHAIERQNRYNLTDLSIQFETFDEALAIEIGDVITVTHNVGLTDKKFRATAVKASKFVGSWIIQADEYDPLVYSDSIQTEPTWPDLNLPDPDPVPMPSDPDLTFEYRLNYSGVIEMWVLIDWLPLTTYPFEHYFEIELNGIDDDMVRIVIGETPNSEILLGAVVPERLHRLNMFTINFEGTRSPERIKYFTPPENEFAPDDVVGFNARGIGNMLRTQWNEVVTAVLYELRYGASGVTWDDSIFIAEVTALQHSTRDILPGTYDILLKATDGTGQKSSNAARVTDVVLTANPDGYIVAELDADHASSILMTLVNLGTEWVTDSGETWNDLFPLAMSTYTNMIYSYQTPGACEYISEELDTAVADFIGIWTTEPGAHLLNGDKVITQVAEVWDSAWNDLGDVVGKFTGSKMRFRVNTTGLVFIVRPGTLLACDIVPYVIRGFSTSDALLPDQIAVTPDFEGFYSASITVSDDSAGYTGTFVFDLIPPLTYVDFYVWDSGDNQVAKDYSYEIRGA
jgi:hypothetical protein